MQPLRRVDPVIVDPASLTAPQRLGRACVVCHKRFPLPRVQVGALPDGTTVLACEDCAAVIHPRR
ncbi:hypothetical protein QP089_14335 [Actinomadura sp. OS1-43]|nr:hypothetical protein [Actinomadura sp. OS1-43]MDL4815453.1 hypothetical protein [Actinomadura sp. OS1-43]